MPPGPWMPTTTIRFSGSNRDEVRHVFITFFLKPQRETVCRKSTPVPLLGPGSMTLVRGLGLNKPHTFPKLHWHPSRLESSIKIQYDFLGRGSGGNRSQEQTRRVCDAATVINANEESMRKQRAGHAMPLQRMVSPAKLPCLSPVTPPELPGDRQRGGYRF